MDDSDLRAGPQDIESRAAFERALRAYVASPENHCFVCGHHNPVGLKLVFSQEDGRVVSSFRPGEWYEGWQGVVHGGILAAILDEAMAYTLFFRATCAVTARMETRYRRAVKAGDNLRVDAQIVRDTKKLVDIEGRILRDDDVAVEAVGRFVKLGPLTPETIRWGAMAMNHESPGHPESKFEVRKFE